MTEPARRFVSRCDLSGGVGIGAGHECRCVRADGHPLDSDRPHGCSCGAVWADKDATILPSTQVPKGEPPPTDRWSEEELAYLRGWVSWLHEQGGTLAALIDEAELLEDFRIGRNPLGRLELVQLMFRAVADDLNRAARDLDAVAAARRAAITGSN